LFEKRTRKAPSEEIELAETRLSEWRRRGAAAQKLRPRKTKKSS
jgi:phage-related protein